MNRDFDLSAYNNEEYRKQQRQQHFYSGCEWASFLQNKIFPYEEEELLSLRHSVIAATYYYLSQYIAYILQCAHKKIRNSAAVKLGNVLTSHLNNLNPFSRDKSQTMVP